jgi:hypothetical protein
MLVSQLPGRQPKPVRFPGKAWDSTWLAFMLRPGTGQPHIPLKHFLFETALALQEPVSEALVDHVPSGPSASDTAPRDREYAAAVQKVVAAYVKRGERARVRDVLTQVGCWGSYRHASAAFPLTAKAVAELKLSPAACRPHWGKGLKRDRRTGQLKESPCHRGPVKERTTRWCFAGSPWTRTMSCSSVTRVNAAQEPSFIERCCSLERR